MEEIEEYGTDCQMYANIRPEIFTEAVNLF
jgi:hypothetical protein